jgi:regulatory protein
MAGRSGPRSQRRRTDRRTTGDGHDTPAPGSSADLTPDADPEAVARAIALRQLTMAPRTRAQLADAMARRGVPDEVATRVLDRFTEVRLVDDEEFAAQWVRSRHQGRGLARRALAYELRHRGVAEDTVRDAVDEIDDETELEAARELVRRRLPGLAGDDPVRRNRRLAGMLARKGYGSATAHRALREVLWQAGSEDLLTGEGRVEGEDPPDLEDCT